MNLSTGVFSPLQRCIPNQIIDRVFDVVIRIHIISVAFDNFALDDLDGTSRVRVSAQVIAKQQRVMLVRVAVDPHMHIRAALPLGLIEKEFGP